MAQVMQVREVMDWRANRIWKGCIYSNIIVRGGEGGKEGRSKEGGKNEGRK